MVFDVFLEMKSDSKVIVKIILDFRVEEFSSGILRAFWRDHTSGVSRKNRERGDVPKICPLQMQNNI